MLPQWLNEAGLGLFESTQISDPSLPSQTSTCCCLLESANLVIWLIEARQVYRIDMSEADLRNKCRSFKLTPVEFLKALRDTFAANSFKYTKQGSNAILTFSSSLFGKLNLELSNEEPDLPSMRNLLLQFGKKHDLMKHEARDLKNAAESVSAAPKAGGTQMDFVMEHRPIHKKPKIDPNMSIINPRSRVIRAPKGVVFADSDEEK